MKKIMFLASMALILGIALTSCRKCETCTAYYVSDNTIADQEHSCGNKIVVNSWEDSFKNTWDYGTTYVECEKD
jgi:hypothetical protein